jgi:murein DD-endopeptidase MepM/ murein hydrolase activator NlpD
LIKKKITFLLLSDSHGRVREWKIPTFFIIPTIAFSIAAVITLYGILSDYMETRSQAHRIGALMDQNERYEAQRVYLSVRLDKVLEKLTELTQQEKKLRILAHLEVEDGAAELAGIGGSDPDNALDAVGEEPLQGKPCGDKKKGNPNVEDLDPRLCSFATGSQPEVSKDTFRPLLPFHPYMMPVPGWVYGGFGQRSSPITGEKEFSKGIEIAAKMKSIVRAPADGVVLYVGKDSRYGRTLVIEHGYGVVTRYGHLDDILVDEGESVPSGKSIAHVGKSGGAFGPTLHYEVTLGGIPVNPHRFPSS